MQVAWGRRPISVVVRQDGGARTKAFHLHPVCLSSGHCGSPLGPHSRNNTPVRPIYTCGNSPVCAFTHTHNETNLRAGRTKAHRGARGWCYSRETGVAAMKQALVQSHTHFAERSGVVCVCESLKILVNLWGYRRVSLHTHTSSWNQISMFISVPVTVDEQQFPFFFLQRNGRSCN